MLRNMGLEVHQAWNGLEAIEQCKKTRYDLIFMDVQVCTVTVRVRAAERGQPLTLCGFSIPFCPGTREHTHLEQCVLCRRDRARVHQLADSLSIANVCLAP